MSLADGAEKVRRAANGITEVGLRFRLVPFEKIALSMSRAYIVKGLVPREGLVIVWGPPKCGKSFWVYDLVMHVAVGWAYRGRRVHSGPVVYVACEGERGLRARTQAFRQRHLAENAGSVPFYLLSPRLNLAADHRQLIEDIRLQLGDEAPVAIVIDTLNRSIEGSESDDGDMGAYIKGADAVREAFACAVIVIHHCGINDRRPRGHTSLTGAADAQIAVKRDSEDRITATVEFMKDGPEGDEVVSRLQVVDVGTDEDGDEITSCVITPVDGAAATGDGGSGRKVQKLNDRQRNAKQAIENFFAMGGGEVPPASNHIPTDRKAALRPIILDVLENGASVAKEVADSKRRREAIGRLLESLHSRGIVGVSGNWIWLAS